MNNEQLLEMLEAAAEQQAVEDENCEALGNSFLITCARFKVKRARRILHEAEIALAEQLRLEGK